MHSKTCSLPFAAAAENTLVAMLAMPSALISEEPPCLAATEDTSLKRPAVAAVEQTFLTGVAERAGSHQGLPAQSFVSLTATAVKPCLVLQKHKFAHLRFWQH